MTELEKKEIGYYAGVGYRDINTYLRNYNGQLLGVKPDIEEKIKRLDYSLQTATLKDTIAVYRRVSETAFGLSNQSLINQNNQVNHNQLQEFKKNFLANIKKNMVI
nr:ADP-ribosyltransferase [Bacillus cereus]